MATQPVPYGSDFEGFYEDGNLASLTSLLWGALALAVPESITGPVSVLLTARLTASPDFGCFRALQAAGRHPISDSVAAAAANIVLVD
jgi:hypothetical protein